MANEKEKTVERPNKPSMWKGLIGATVEAVRKRNRKLKIEQGEDVQEIETGKRTTKTNW